MSTTQSPNSPHPPGAGKDDTINACQRVRKRVSGYTKQQRKDAMKKAIKMIYPDKGQGPDIDLLKSVRQALDDWIVTSSQDLFDPEHANVAWKRILGQGGTIAFVTDLRENEETLLATGAGETVQRAIEAAFQHVLLNLSARVID